MMLPGEEPERRPSASQHRPAPPGTLCRGCRRSRAGSGAPRSPLRWAPSRSIAGAAAGTKMKSSDVDQELFTESYCRVCSAQLISESQRVAHYESRKHASKVRLYYMLHPADGGCPAKKLRSENGSDGDSVDKNKCCTLCNMSFTSAVVAESHYQGKIHAKRLKLLLGEQPALKATVSRCPAAEETEPPRSPVSWLHHFPILTLRSQFLEWR
ncbi:zinc finger matrin-type protein 4 isoform X6 [Patagioenas fasciata]|uniref:zinc finger matrin-type protein 4 isoform X6 n=1 Tax=Patagioenas fasciata TaxID=372321 RepID=UPI003A995D8B